MRGRIRVLVEFPESLLRRTDEAVGKMAKNRSELIRTAVEQMLEQMEKSEFDMELAAAYTANAPMSMGLTEEFSPDSLVDDLADILDRLEAENGPDWINICRHALADANEVASISREAAKVFHSRGVPLSHGVLVLWGIDL